MYSEPDETKKSMLFDSYMALKKLDDQCIDPLGSSS